jgi:phosphoglycerate kinase
MVKNLSNGDILMLENTRFDGRESSKEAGERDAMAKELAELADVYVNDAFGTAHRDHASTCSIAKFMKGQVYAGFLMEREVQYLDPILHNPAKPMVAIIGGAKVSSKIAVLESLLKTANALIIGGGMAYTFLKAQGHKVGKSLVEDDFIKTANTILASAKANNVQILLPLDHQAAQNFADVTATYVDGLDLADNLMGLDVGPKTLASYTQVISSAKTVVWNGPVGVFEFNNFATGTQELAKMVGEVKAKGGISVVGGGDSVAAVNKFKLADKMSHVSTGGGASLEYLEGKDLPGIVALKR